MNKIRMGFSLVLIFVIISICFNMFYKEQMIDHERSIAITDIQYKLINRSNLFNELLNQDDYMPIAKKDAWSPYTVSKSELDLETYIIKLKPPNDFYGSSLVHIKGVFGSSLDIYDTFYNKIYTHNDKNIPKNYYELFSEVFVKTENRVLFLVIDVNNTSNTLGLFKTATVSDSSSLVLNRFDSDETRHSIGFFLIILSLLLFIVGYYMKFIEGRDFIISIAMFLACFGLWIFTDIYRHSKWISVNFPFLSPYFIAFVFAISNNFLIPTFVKVNHFIIKHRTSKIVIDIFLKTTMIFASLSFMLETLKLFYWDRFINSFYYLVVESLNIVIIVGSLALLVLALYDMKKRDMKRIVYGTGLSICILSFIISQSTGILVSHWGVIVLLATIAFVFIMKFNELSTIHSDTCHNTSSNSNAAAITFEKAINPESNLGPLNDYRDWFSSESSSIHTENQSDDNGNI
ncbi:hypothetical protein [Fusibacter sp. JL216-2]|uniref:hypothetical protein n=1 Tax=Fusibacter sp. JL216-2 TaxID=3071453 RepID=UPI003D339EEC